MNDLERQIEKLEDDCVRLTGEIIKLRAIAAVLLTALRDSHNQGAYYAARRELLRFGLPEDIEAAAKHIAPGVQLTMGKI